MSQLTIEKVPVPNPTGIKNQVHRFMQRTGFAYMTPQDDIAFICLVVMLYYICHCIKRMTVAVMQRFARE